MEKAKKRVRVRIKQRIKLKPKSSKQRRRNRALFFFLWSSAVVTITALYLANFGSGNRFTVMPARRASASEVRDAIVEIETLLEALEKKIEKEEGLSRDLNTLIAQKEIIEGSEFKKTNPRVRKFVELLDSIEVLKKENDTDTRVLLIKVKQVKDYLERNKTGSSRK